MSERRAFSTDFGMLYIEDLIGLIDSLTPAQAEAFLMVARSENQREAAEKLGISYGALRKRLWQGRRRIRGGTW